MFLFNFYSNDNDYIVLLLAGFFLSIFLFFLSMSFNSKKIFALFLSTVFISLMINVNKFPLIVIIISTIILLYISLKFSGEIKYKIFTNLVTVFVFGVLAVSGVFALNSYLSDGLENFSSHQKQEKSSLRIETNSSK